MYLHDVFEIQLLEPAISVNIVITTVGVKIVKVEQQMATAGLAQLIKKANFIENLIGVFKEVNIILQQKWDRDARANLSYPRSQQIKCFLIVWQRQSHADVYIVY